MDDAKLGMGEGRKAAAATPDENGAPRLPLVPSEKGNAAAPGGQRRREVASRFKPVDPPAPAAARRCTSPSPARASASINGAASCNRARSADRARPAAASSAPSSPHPKPSAATAARSATPARDAVIAEARGGPRATSGKTPDDLRKSAARSPSPSPRPRSEPLPAPATKIDRLVRGLPSEVARVKVQLADAAPPGRNRSPVRRNGVGNQCENARPSDTPATKRVVEQHRWPAMMSGRGSAGGLTSANIAPSSGNASRPVSLSNRTAGQSPMRVRPSEGTGKCLSPSSEMAKRAAIRRSRRVDEDSDSSSHTSEGSRSACRQSRAVPVPVLHRSSSTSKAVSAASPTSKACPSPSRTRPSASCRSKCASSAAQPGSAAQPVFNYILDARKGKKTASQAENIHQLRLLDNRFLQWRFVNTISEATMSVRRNSAESTIFSVSNSISTLQDALTTRRIDVRFLQQEMKLHHIVTEQIPYLKQWPELEEENNSTLAEAIEALKASTLRLPVTSGAQAEVVAVKNAVSSAVDVMQALSSSICYLKSKVEDRASLVCELSVLARQEKAALDECRRLLATAAELQVQESSIRTHLMQLRDDSG